MRMRELSVEEYSNLASYLGNMNSLGNTVYYRTVFPGGLTIVRRYRDGVNDSAVTATVPETYWSEDVLADLTVKTIN